ncbi:Hsp70 family protein [Stackebrandtia soli]|uniref:Hsp70 family protein n=1 Tax=Stackebrandtia soli TaxID=1892856 RepID=UPI0039EBFBF5
MSSPVHLGVDFGTSHTVAVLRHDDGSMTPLMFDGSPLLASAVYAANDGQLRTGRDALHSARIDPTRFEPNPKRRVDDGALLLGDAEPSIIDVFAAVLRRVRQETVRVYGAVPPTTLTHPATWGPTRRLALEDAAMAAGYPGPRLLPEPVAAAMYFGWHNTIVDGSSVVVFDFGGGTLDVSAVERSVSGFRVVTVDGAEDLGGVDIDHRLIEHLGTRYGDKPEWARLMSPQSPDDRRMHRLFIDDVRSAKEQLSRHNRTELVVPLIGEETHLTREELEALTGPLLARAIRVTRAVIRSSTLTPDRIAGLFLVGGASRMPLVATMLHRETGIAPTIIDQPELVVAHGATFSIGLIDEASTPRTDQIVAPRQRSDKSRVHTPAPIPAMVSPAVRPSSPPVPPSSPPMVGWPSGPPVATPPNPVSAPVSPPLTAGPNASIAPRHVPAWFRVIQGLTAVQAVLFLGGTIGMFVAADGNDDYLGGAIVSVIGTIVATTGTTGTLLYRRGSAALWTAVVAIATLIPIGLTGLAVNEHDDARFFPLLISAPALIFVPLLIHTQQLFDGNTERPMATRHLSPLLVAEILGWVQAATLGVGAVIVVDNLHSSSYAALEDYPGSRPGALAMFLILLLLSVGSAVILRLRPRRIPHRRLALGAQYGAVALVGVTVALFGIDGDDGVICFTLSGAMATIVLTLLNVSSHRFSDVAAPNMPKTVHAARALAGLQLTALVIGWLVSIDELATATDREYDEFMVAVPLFTSAIVAAAITGWALAALPPSSTFRGIALGTQYTIVAATVVLLAATGLEFDTTGMLMACASPAIAIIPLTHRARSAFEAQPPPTITGTGSYQ